MVMLAVLVSASLSGGRSGGGGVKKVYTQRETYNAEDTVPERYSSRVLWRFMRRPHSGCILFFRGMSGTAVGQG